MRFTEICEIRQSRISIPKTIIEIHGPRGQPRGQRTLMAMFDRIMSQRKISNKQMFAKVRSMHVF